MQPVRHQGVLRAAKHAADIAWHVRGRVEVGVVFDEHRQQHLHGLRAQQGPISQGHVVAQGGLVVPQKLAEAVDELLPRRPAHGKQGVQVVLAIRNGTK